MKQLKKDLQTVMKSLKAMADKVEKMHDRLETSAQPKARVKTKAKAVAGKTPKKAAAPKEAPKKAGTETAYDTFLGIINRSKKGVSVDQLKSKTGFNDKKIANLVYKAKKQGKIKSSQKGLYTKA